MSGRINLDNMSEDFKSYIQGLGSQLEHVVIKEELSYINIKDFGAIGDGVTDDSSSIQSAIDYASSNKLKVFIPKGTFLLNNNIWLPSNSIIYGVGKSSILNFSSGYTIRTEKGGKRGYRPSNNYFNEDIPVNAGDCNISLTVEAVEGDYVLQVNNTNLLNVGDYIYTFNKDETSWVVLEDPSQSDKWNDFINYPLGQMEVFKITELTTNTITLHKPLLFNLPINAPVRKLLGSVNIELENFTIQTVNQQIHCEQIRDCVFKNLNLLQTGITLDNKSYNNKVINNYIENDSGRCITVCSFSCKNIITGNNCTWKEKGDSVIIIMMANNNTVSNNIISGISNTKQDRIGICIHARSYSNTVSGNVLNNLNAGIGLYYGCYKNTITGNTCNNCLTDLNSYYSNEAMVSNLIGYNSTVPRSGMVERSILAFKCVNINIDGCSSNKTVYFEHSINCNINNSIINVKNNPGICILGDIKKSACFICNNTINGTTGIKIQHSTYFDWRGFESINITGNKITANIGIDNKYAYYLKIDNNVFDCSEKGFTTVNGGSFQTITNNKFMNSDVGINCNNNLEASVIFCRDNVFSNVNNKISGFVFPHNTTAAQIRGGVYGFKVYNLNDSLWTNQYCVYKGDRDGIQTNESWYWNS